jgi:hypothetical protein
MFVTSALQENQGKEMPTPEAIQEPGIVIYFCWKEKKKKNYFS